MEIHEIRSDGHSNHSQQAQFINTEGDEEEHPHFVRRLSKGTLKQMTECQTVISLDHNSHQEESVSIFDRRPIPVCQRQQKSLLAAQKISRSFTRVYFFDGDRFRDYYRGDFEQHTTIGEFIKEVVEDYCEFFLQFHADITNSNSFELKLADLHNRHDPIMEELDHADELESYFGSTLCLIRRINRDSNLKLIQQKLKENSEAFQVSIPFQNGRRTFEVERGRTFGVLIEKMFRACDIGDAPSDYLLVEYNKFITYNKSILIDDIPDRDFELLQAKKEHFTDESANDDEITDKQRIKQEKPLLVPCLLAQLHPNEPIREIFTTEVQTHFYEGNMTLSIENCVFVERYSKCLVSQLLEFVCEQQYEKRYPLTTLTSAYADEDCLVLVFLVRDVHITRRYRIPEHKRVLYLSEILRLCRVYRKTLTLPSKEPV